jgi:hypothetical protein
MKEPPRRASYVIPCLRTIYECLHSSCIDLTLRLGWFVRKYYHIQETDALQRRILVALATLRHLTIAYLCTYARTEYKHRSSWRNHCCHTSLIQDRNPTHLIRRRLEPTVGQTSPDGTLQTTFVEIHFNLILLSAYLRNRHLHSLFGLNVVQSLSFFVSSIHP